METSSEDDGCGVELLYTMSSSSDIACDYACKLSELATMATSSEDDGCGVELLYSMSSSSDIACDYACTHCVRNHGSYMGATYYCPECDAYFCQDCLDNYLCQHRPLDRAKLSKWGRPTNRKPGVPCTEHTDNKIKLYCSGHDDVGCHICVAEHHQDCTSMVYITELVAKTSIKQEIESTRQDIVEMKSTLPKASKSRAKKKNELETAYSAKKTILQEFRGEINNLLDDLENQSLAELDDMKEAINNHIDNNAQLCDRQEQVVESLLKKLQRRNIDDTLRFIWMKQSRETLEDGKKAASELLEDTDPLPFEFHTEIKCLQGLTGLGKFYRKDLIMQRQSIDMPYSFRKKDRINIKHDLDKKTALIFSMCQLHDGSCVLSDNNNRCLKHINASNKLINRCQLLYHPFGVCYTGDQEVAVAFDNHTVQYVSIGSTMKTTTKIHLKYKCADLAYSNDKLYATNRDSSIHVYNKLGVHEREIIFDKHVSFNVKQIKVSPDGKTMYVTNPNRNMLLTIDNEGNVINTFIPERNEYLWSVCLDKVGNVFVCGRDSNNIIQVASTGERKITDIERPLDDIKKPRALCVDRNNSRLLVSYVDSDTIHEFGLIQKRQ